MTAADIVAGKMAYVRPFPCRKHAPDMTAMTKACRGTCRTVSFRFSRRLPVATRHSGDFLMVRSDDTYRVP